MKMAFAGCGCTLMTSLTTPIAKHNPALKFELRDMTTHQEFGSLRVMAGFVPNGTTGPSVVQIHGATHESSTIILRIYDGELRYYSGDLIASNMYDKWFKVNLIHDVDEGKVTVFIDNEQKFETKDRGPGDLYFKCGVYAAPKNISYYMESRWRDIKIYKK